jgi:hypothetical protein
MSKNPRPELEKAFKTLLVARGQEGRMGGMIDSLLGFAGKTNVKPPPRLREVSHKRAQGELRQLLRSIDALAIQLDKLHRPVIVALADRGVLAHSLGQSLRKISEAARAADLTGVSEQASKGRPPKVGPNVLTEFLASCYKSLTGKAPTVVTDWDTGKAYGPFLQLVSDVFMALEVKANPEDAARKVVRKKEKKRQAKRT